MENLLYIDPGTGSLIIQLLAATAMGVVVAFQSVRIWIKNIFCSIFRRNGSGKSDSSE